VPAGGSARAPDGGGASAADVGALVSRLAAEAPERPALAAPDREPLSYAGLRDELARVRAALRGLGVGRDDRVALALPDGPEMAVAFLAVASAARAAPLNPAYRRAEHEFTLRDLGARALLLPEGAEASAAAAAAGALGIPRVAVRARSGPAGAIELFGERPAAPARERPAALEDEALVLHTSGTTSRPKIVPLSHRNLRASAARIAATLALAPEDRCLALMPLFHIHGLVGALLATWSSGGCLLAPPGFDAGRFFAWLVALRPTWTTAVPTMYQALLARAGLHADAIRRAPLRLLRSSSAPLPPAVLAELERVFGAPVIESYGMTEAAHQIASNPLPPGLRKPGSVGLPAGPEVAILDATGARRPAGERGEVAIRGESVTAGYEGAPDANAAAFADGWLRTGDQGFLDADGYLHLTGRLKEIINRGGEKVSPREVDEALLEHPAVAQAVAFAVPHPRLGEEVAAAVVLRAPGAADARELLAHAAERLADFKLPRRIVFVDAVPKGPTGKLQRIGLAERLGVQMGEPAGPSEYTAPRDADEARVAALFAEVLERERVGVHDDFFALGGDSLALARLLFAVADAFGVELPVYDLFEEPTPARVTARVRAAADAAPPAPPIRRGDPAEPAPLAFAQRALYGRERLAGASPADHRPGALRLLGPLDPRALAEALTGIVARHEPLRTRYPVRAGRPVQEVVPAEPVSLPREDLAALPAAARDERLRSVLWDDARRPFDLAAGPWPRFRLLRLGPDDHVLVAVFHHVAFDGWSWSLFRDELLARLEAAAAGRPAELPPLPIRYGDHALWQAERVAGGALAAALETWRRRLADAPGPTRVARREPDPEACGRAGESCVRALPPDLWNPLREAALGAGATPFMALYAAFAALVSEISGDTDLRLGTLGAGRQRPETRDLVGLFVNPLPVRVDASGDPAPRELLRRVRGRLVEVYAGQEVPFEAIVKALRPPARPGRNPLFDAVLEHRNLPVPRDRAGALTAHDLAFDWGAARADLFVETEERGGGVRARFEWDTAAVDGASARAWADRFVALLEAAARAPDQRGWLHPGALRTGD